MTNRSDELQGVRKLYKFSRLLLEGDDPDELVHRLVKAVRAITEADEVILFLLEGGEPKIHARACDQPGDNDPGMGPGEEPDYSATLVREVVDRAEPLLLKDVDDDPRFQESRSVQVLSITSAMGAPLYHDGEMVGVIYASRMRAAQNFTEDHRDLMTVAASQAGLLLSRLASVQALRDSESRYRSLVEMSPVAIAVVQSEQLMFANRTACSLWDCESVTELVGRRIRDLFDPWRSQPLCEALRCAEMFEAVDAWATTDRGERGKPVEVTGRPIRFEGDEAMQLVIRPAGESSQRLEQRVREDRLRVMGTMASTVGHEINNPLSYVYANLDFAIEELSRGLDSKGDAQQLASDALRELMEGLRSARDGTERIRTVVDSMQRFSELDDCDGCSTVERPLRSSLRIARAQLGDDVQVDVDIHPTDPVALDAARLGQVFLNLLVNAADALREVNGRDKDKRLTIRARSVDDEVVVEITDTGPGIDEEVQQHIFEPFVSTKSSESGDGLGLAICREIVEAAAGRIDVDSTRGEQTTFQLHLPVADAEPKQSGDACPPTHEPPPTGEPGNILVAETEPLLCRSLQRVLQHHRVEAATTKGEAIELLETTTDFDLLLCDLRFREGLGRDLFAWIRRHTPRCWHRLVAMAPSRPNPAQQQYLEQLPNPSISKPFELNELRALIGRLLRSQPAESPPAAQTESSTE